MASLAPLAGRTARRVVGLAAMSLAVVASSFSSRHVLAQARPESRAVPRDEYFLAMRIFYSGQYRSALKAFKDVAGGGIRSTEGRWVDSICYYTMAGECYYHLGEPALALSHYESALKLFLQHKDWMLRVQFPNDITASNANVRSRITWGATSRATRLGNFPDTMMSFQGQLDAAEALRTGGVVTPPQFFPLRVTEIVRCTALALRRRAELLGPAGEHSILSARLVEALSGPIVRANHWSKVWVEAQLGLAQAGAGKRAQAVAHLRRAIAIGDFDHHVTPIVLLELGKLFLQDDRLEQAANYFLEATLAGAQYGHADVIEEGFRYALIAHLASGKKNVYPQLLMAAPWAKTRNFHALEGSLYTMASENYATVRDTNRAAALLDDARSVIGRNEMLTGDVGARYRYQTALVHFQQGNGQAGTVALAEALAFQKKASPRLFHVALIDKLYTGGTITARVAMDLYALVLAEPLPSDWAFDPLDAMAVTMTPLPLPMEHWFETALIRKHPELALEITDLIRRRRFNSAMPMGGRLVSLRWIMEAPVDSLPQQAALQRQDLMLKYPHYAALKRQSDELRAQLSAMELAPGDSRQIQQQKKLYKDWAAVSATQEAVLSEIAVRREGVQIVFPPIRKTAEIQAGMREGQLGLSFLNTSRYLYAFVFTKDKYAHWQVEQPASVTKKIGAMLREMGHYDGNQPLGGEQLADGAWKQQAGELMGLLMNNMRADFWDDYDELIVVPDSVLWYLPFEALQVPVRGGSVPLISKIRIRYAPTASMIAPDVRGRKRDGNTVVVTGRLYPRDDQRVADEALAELQRDVPGTATLGTPLVSSTGMLSTLWDRLVVLDDIDDPARGAFMWSPGQLDRGKPGSTLADWFPLPWGSPELVVLPGFHTPAESGLKRPAAGDEIFLAVCGMMSTGTRTILISRWRTGGQTSYDLMREFVRELPRTSAASAWQRAVYLARETLLQPDREPRTKLGPGDDLLKSEHPFFWSGYLLVDTGADPAAENAHEKVAVDGKP